MVDMVDMVGVESLVGESFVGVVGSLNDSATSLDLAELVYNLTAFPFQGSRNQNYKRWKKV